MSDENIKKLVDATCEIIDEKLFNNPQALNKLKVLEVVTKTIDAKIVELNEIQKTFDAHANDMLDILDILKTREYCLPNKFRAYVTTRREIEVYDEIAFMNWLKETFTPDEVIKFLMPPTTKSDLKKFCEKYINETNEPIPGVNTEAQFIHVKTDYKGFTRVKKRKEYGSYRRKK